MEILTTLVVSNGLSLLKRTYITTRYIIWPLHKGISVITKKVINVNDAFLCYIGTPTLVTTATSSKTTERQSQMLDHKQSE